MRSRFASAVVGVALTLCGCASVPTGGAVHLGREVPQAQGLGDLDVRVLPPAWHPGLGPQEVVSGFLRALVNDDDDYAIARSFLTASASAGWRPSAGITTYDETAIRQTQGPGGAPGRVTIQLRAPRIGSIDERGDYHPAGGTLAASFSVARQGTNGWRIDRLANGVVLSASDAQRSFRVVDVYYFNRARTRLVPEQILLQSSQRGVATARIAALLAGPDDWLAPAVRSVVPSGTTLVGNVPVHDNGVADVNLSGAVRLASSADLAAMSAQIGWTLRQVSDVTSFRLLAEGTPLSVSGLPARQPVSAWGRYDPAAPPSTRDVLYVHGGRLAATGGDEAALRRSDPGQAVSVARSRDGEQLAVVQDVRGRERLLTGRFGDRLRPRFSAATMTPPTFTDAGDVVTAAETAAGTQLLAVNPAGAVRRLAADESLPRGGLRELRFSGDGARVAAVTSSGSLLIGRLSGSPGSEELGGFRSIVPSLSDIRGVAWADADTLAATAAGTPRQVVQVDSVGYAVRTVPLEGLSGEAVDVAASPGEPLLVATDAGVIWMDVEGWRLLARGSAPVHSG